MHDACVVPFGSTSADAGARRTRQRGRGRRAAFPVSVAVVSASERNEDEPGAQRAGPFRAIVPSRSFYRWKPRPIGTGTKKANSVPPTPIGPRFGKQNCLDRPTVIRKATSQTTLSALEPAPSPAPKSRRRRVWRLATGDGPRTWPLVQDSTRRRHWEARAHRPTRVSILRPIKSPRIVPTARLT